MARRRVRHKKINRKGKPSTYAASGGEGKRDGKTLIVDAFSPSSRRRGKLREERNLLTDLSEFFLP